MRAIPIERGSGRPIALRIPSEGTGLRRHQQFRWWSLDIEPHKEMISGLRGSSARELPDVKRDWLAYLKSIDGRKIATSPAAGTAQGIWKTIERSSSAILPPNARPTEEGGLRLSWNRGGRYVEVLIAPDGTFEWFYTDTNDVYDGAEDLSLGAAVDSLLARLRDMF